MMRVIRSELVRLRNPYLILGGIGLMAALSLMATTIMFVTAGEEAMGPGDAVVTQAMLEAADGMFVAVRNAFTMLGIVALAIWATVVTSDYANGLIRLLVQAEPSRLRLLIGKIVALAVFTCLATLVTTVVVFAASPGIASIAGISTSAWYDDLLRIVVETYLDLTLAALLWGMAGLFVGMIVRSTGVAVAIGIGYLMVFEGLLGLLLEDASKWLPGSSFSAIAAGGTPDMTYGTALLVAAAYAGAMIVAAALVFHRRDITA
jgi:ABC-type transport system involved in multi-copper enzyme maturation permease subunit